LLKSQQPPPTANNNDQDTRCFINSPYFIAYLMY
jgi:hypothetical protein